MPNRILRDGMIDSDRVNACDEPSEVLLYRLIQVADDYGRFDGRLSIIRARCFPLRQDVTEAEIERRLAELASKDLIVRYTVAGKHYVEIPRFGQRQRAEKSKFPSPPANCPTAVEQMTVTCQTSAPEDGEGGASAVIVGGEGEDGGRAPDAHGLTPSPDRSPALQVAMVTMLRDAGVTGVARLTVDAWTQRGVTLELVRTAVDLALEKIPKPKPIPFKYAASIVERLRTEQAAPPEKLEIRDKNCSLIDETGKRCGAPGVRADPQGRNWRCREHAYM